jgi:hypothetical protein
MTLDCFMKMKRSRASTPSESGVEYFDCLALLHSNHKIGSVYPSPIYFGNKPS